MSDKEQTKAQLKMLNAIPVEENKELEFKRNDLYYRVKCIDGNYVVQATSTDKITWIPE
jgi:hypothetical protein